MIPRPTNRERQEISISSDAPKRFAIIGNAALPLSNFRGPLIADIVSRGHTVFALAPDFDDGSRGRLRTLGATAVDYPLMRTGLNPLSDLSSALTLRRILKDLKPDVVLSFGIKPAIYGTLAARVAGVPARFVLIAGLGYAFTENGRSSWKRRVVGHLARSLYRFSLRHAERIFMQNPDDTSDFVRLGIAPSGKIVTVNGTGVRLDDWPPAPPITDPLRFTLAARMIRDKGIVEFVDAARMIKSSHPNARFALIGALDTNPEAIDERQLRSWVDEGLIEWPGHVDMREWLARTSVFVLPSYYREGVPRSTQEAMAMARPIITTDAPGCRETVVDGRNGFLVPVRDSKALAAAMLRFIDQPALIARMGKESRALAEERFDATKINAVMMHHMAL